MVDEVSKDVAEIRGLEFKRPVPLKTETTEEIRQFVLGELAKQWPPERLQADERAWKTVGLLPSDYDLQKELVEIYCEQIAGLYDQRNDRMILVKTDFTKALTRMLLSHELTHALQDQHFDLDKLIEERPDTLDSDFALGAFIEGDASAVMRDYLLTRGPNRLELLGEAFGAMAQSRKLLSAPPLVRRMLLCPYTHGMEFVDHFRRDGWGRVNEIYGDLPLSAEQIMHPRKYWPQRDFPTRIDLGKEWRRPPGGKWRDGPDTTLGEMGVIALTESWSELLQDRDLGRSAFRVANGWDGDHLLSSEEPSTGETVLSWVSTWDRPEDARQMRDALAKWVKKWAESETDANYLRTVTLTQPQVAGTDGPDIVCIMVRLRKESPPLMQAVPPYGKQTIRSRKELGTAR
jgi:hypothetical protein